MTLIKDMLDNLESRNNTGEKKPKTANNDKQAARAAVIKESRRNGWPVGLITGFVAAGVLVVGVSTYFVMTPQHFQMAKNKISSTVEKLITAKSSKSIALKQNNQGAIVTTEKNNSASAPKSSSTVHAMYLIAIKNLNEGNIDKAISELKIIIAKDPSFQPAQETYKAINSRYGINQKNQ